MAEYYLVVQIDLCDILRRVKIELALILVAFVGCQKTAPPDNLSPEFKKSGKFAYALLQQADQGTPVSSADLSRALAEVQASASNKDEQMAASMLGSYRADIDYTAMRVTQEQLASRVASMKWKRCEIEKMLNEGFKGVEAMKACGEKLGG
jgi:hypothetical protein